MISLIRKLLIAVAILAITTTNDVAGQDGTLATTEQVFDHYGVGREVRGATIFVTYQYKYTHDRPREQINLDYTYNEPDGNKITQVLLLVETDEQGGSSEAYLTGGGIDQSTISLRIIGKNTAQLRYMVIVFGLKSDK
ncbi:uncharacterized protein [Musca autumnalis]|uniref:uncharacterized protein n=1 Tax=Musca autumnalis TaxID=221902 RepID=UPI003CEB7E1D